MLRIGIDEAGLGPTLGPLVVAGAAFRVADDGAPFDVDLSARLAPALGARGRGARAGRGGAGTPLVVGDSKAVFGPTHDLAVLELPVLAFAACRDGADGRVPATLDELLASVGADPAERLLLPWYAGVAPALPCAADPEDVADAASRLRDALAACGVRFGGFRADVVPESRLNRAFGLVPNKADLLFERSAHVLDGLASLRAPGETFGAVFDRQGGRRFYLPPILSRWPQRFTSPLEETPTVSRYAVHLGDATAELRFVVGGDAAAPETGLASMLAKYLREVFMGLWNDYFAGVCPGVPRTAGYATDARRWLDASRAHRIAAGIGDDRLVRTR